MQQSNEKKVKIYRISRPPEFPGNPRYLDPRLPKDKTNPTLEPDLVPGPTAEAIPYELPSPGDRVDKEGYIEYLRFDEQYYAPLVPEGANYYGNLALERDTYCLVRLSRSVNSSDNVREFRILYHGTSQVPFVGEGLAISMGIIGALKDAFLNKCKVTLHGELSQLEVRVPTPGGRMGFAQGFTTSTSDLFIELQSIDLIREY